MNLALGKVASFPFSEQSIYELKHKVIADPDLDGLAVERDASCRSLRRSSAAVGDVARGARACPARMPRPPALYKAKKKWIQPEQADPQDHLEGEKDGTPAGAGTIPQQLFSLTKV